MTDAGTTQVRRREPPDAPGGWLVWAVGLLAYAVAVFHRASLGVAGVQAQERFGAGASAVSLFVVAAAGGLRGAAGARSASRSTGSARAGWSLLGALTMAAGQLALALADDVPDRGRWRACWSAPATP